MKPTAPFKIAIAGGGSTYTTGIISSLLSRSQDFPVGEVRLFDKNEQRQHDVALLVRLLLKKENSAIKLVVSTDPQTAFSGVDFVFSQIRAGGLEMREQDERIPLAFGCVGQETCGPGGMAYALRTIPDIIKITEWVCRYAPNAWILNYSNPAAVVSEATRRLFPKAKIINICDQPIAMQKAFARALNLDVNDFIPSYFGLNHFGWWTHLYSKNTGEDLLPRIIEHIKKEPISPLTKDPKTDQGRIDNYHMLTQMLQHDSQYLPNTYLQYYLFGDTILKKSDPDHTRARAIIENREKDLFDLAAQVKQSPDPEKIAIKFGVHGEYIVDLAKSIAFNEYRRFILIVENHGAIPNFRPDSMVEVPAYLGSNGPEPIARAPIPDFYKGMMETQCAVEKLLVDAALENSYHKALQAFTLSRTVPSAAVAKNLLDSLIKANKGFWPELK